MKVGTKSILFGVHQFILHPIFVFIAWWKLYGFPKDPRLWVAFIVHDLGYFGKPNMDGVEGDTHVEFGANFMHRWFDLYEKVFNGSNGQMWLNGKNIGKCTSFKIKIKSKKWYNFCLYHSRFYAKKHNALISKLCVADKYSIVITPNWLYLLLGNLSGEINEYISRSENGKYVHMNVLSYDKLKWLLNVKSYLNDWIKVHKNNSEDTWTKLEKQ